MVHAKHKTMLATLLFGVTIILPLLSQNVWLNGYCLSCKITSCPPDCVDDKFLGRPFAICATCEPRKDNPDNPELPAYACTACNFVHIKCVPEDSCPPYRQDIQPFVNVGGERPFRCVVIAPGILGCVPE